MADEPDAALAVEPQLTDTERRRAWVVGLVPVGLAAAVMTVLAVAGRATLGDVIVGIVFYGGLLGMTAGVVVHERLSAGHCLRCNAAGPAGRATCDDCGYDLAERPLYRCEDRHRRYVEPGLCECGRRLRAVERPRGLDREIKRTLWAGAWVAAFLFGVVVLLPFFARPRPPAPPRLRPPGAPSWARRSKPHPLPAADGRSPGTGCTSGRQRGKPHPLRVVG